ncbi:conserved hypothetical protein (plasmid) [Thermomicrobium roseum DSM 5159]|uniref:Uncharacterized protein n=1 Tax=Thermomicrobium roseum (strain ATCC 27502 / DSM 5159 / P-2) TaxID=309801 RepID=B9L352_THERP|nr:conserved hypothetical protein [Thermomicrobium roseum DSM 5159]
MQETPGAAETLRGYSRLEEAGRTRPEIGRGSLLRPIRAHGRGGWGAALPVLRWPDGARTVPSSGEAVLDR